MNDLISRQQAIDELNNGAELLRRVLDDVDIVGAEREKFKCELELIESCVSDIKELPSAVDCQKCIFCGFPGFKQFQSAQPEIIRCKDCKWFNASINQCNRQIAADFFENDFCSYAERITDETN